VVLVGAVITLNVSLGGMKGITVVQAFQYWAKMFAISAPIFMLMAVYGHYGEQLGANGRAGMDAANNPPTAFMNGSTPQISVPRKALAEKAPRDENWLNPLVP
jgi:Na+(H+)/acetate symporter ActP